ncbi:MAG TPA: hypothetical protein VFU49_20080 [Ktedonobacteraceae bacterium]|nr:hypothetical protein [Ktedonobacteraceae bacterium]
MGVGKTNGQGKRKAQKPNGPLYAGQMRRGKGRGGVDVGALRLPSWDAILGRTGDKSDAINLVATKLS